jgi:NAD dependent epimerase/dehydratase family enzyme
MTRRLAAHFRRPQWAAAPARLLRGALGEFSDLFLASQRVVPHVALDLGFVFTRPTLERAFAKPDAPLRLAAPTQPPAPAAIRPAA